MLISIGPSSERHGARLIYTFGILDMCFSFDGVGPPFWTVRDARVVHARYCGPRETGPSSNVRISEHYSPEDAELESPELACPRSYAASTYVRRGRILLRT